MNSKCMVHASFLIHTCDVTEILRHKGSDLKCVHQRFIWNQFYAAFTLSGFDDQERNLTFVKTAF